MRERPKHLEKAVADPRNEEPASPLRWETALKDQAERVAALRRALLAPWHACPGLPLPRGVHGPYQKRPCRKKWSGKALRSPILATLLFGINALLKPSRAGSATGVLPPFPVPCPGASHCCIALLCYACGVPTRPAVHGGASVSLPCTC